MVSKRSSVNIGKIKELAEKLNQEFEQDRTNNDLIKEIKHIVEIETNNMNSDNKLECYEKMCQKIKIILNKYKFS